jgi:predicted nucleic acid-binding protein
MTVLLDTNLVIDVLIRREPFFEFSQLVLLAIEENYLVGYVSASAITDIYYIVNKHLKNKSEARKLLINHLLDYVKVASVDGSIISNALNIDWDDFEDAVQYCVGENVEVDYIVTRNQKDFASGTISTLSPEELINIIAPEETYPSNTDN